MELDQLRYFTAVAETQHVGQAARALHISPSAISHSIKKLEDELGQKLLEKRGKNVRLTEEGHRLAVKAKDLLERADRLKQELRSQDLPLEGCYRIGASHALSNLILAPLLGEFQSAHPEVRFEVYSLRSAQVVEQLVAGILDIGFCFSPYPHPELFNHGEFSSPLRIAVRRRHPLLAVKPRQLAQKLSVYPYAAPKAYSGIENCEDHPVLRDAGIKATPAFIFDSYEVASGYVQRTDSWCLIPEFLIEALGLRKIEVSGFEAEVMIATLGAKGRMLPPQLLEKLRTALIKSSR